MFSLFLRFGAWLVRKLGGAVLIVALGLGACAVWLYLRDNVDFDAQRSAELRRMAAERAQLDTALAEVRERLARYEAEIAAQEERLRTAERIIAVLRGDESLWRALWNRLFGPSDQARTTEERLARVEKIKADSAARVAQLRELVARTIWERDGLEISRGRIDQRQAKVEREESAIVHYLENAWLRTRWYVISALAVWFLGPTLGALTLYYGLAPLARRGKPIQLAGPAGIPPEVGESRVSVEAALRPGECAWVKERFLQASDESLRRRTRFVLDWRIPFTCAACGLIELVELAAEQNGQEGRVTFSNQDDPHIEQTIVSIPEGGSLVLRPSYLAGVINPRSRRLTIRRHWRLFMWQSWVTLQFRYFEFVGPCRLVVAGSRGVRAEAMDERPGEPYPARRTNQNATIGFTPWLLYRPARAETFWAYYRGMNPLFDDLFEGNGLFLCQEIAQKGRPGTVRAFWSQIWNGLLKIFGM